MINQKRRQTKYRFGTVSLAKHEGPTVVSLLWRKILFSVTPETREMLLTCTGLRQTCERISPVPIDHQSWDDDDRLRNEISKAESYLTGGTLEELMGWHSPTLPRGAGRVGELASIATDDDEQDRLEASAVPQGGAGRSNHEPTQ